MKYILFFLLLVSVTCSGQIYQVDASGGGQIVRYYTTDSVWYKPVGLVGIQVVCIGGGGGGASGGYTFSVAGTQNGGKGGGGGAIERRYLQASVLPDSVNILVGLGGNGGAIRNTSGYNAGSNGTNTVFTGFVTANFGEGATNNTIGGTGGSAQFGNVYSIAGGNGSNGGAAAIGTNAAATGFATTGINGGAGGGGVSSGGTTKYNGGTGGRMRDADYVQSTAAAAGIAPGGNGVNGLDNVSLQLDFYRGTTPILSYGAGSSGSGGAGNSGAGVLGGNGGNGGLYGAGGGGGGGCTDSVGTGFSGAGGNGAQGLCIVIEYY